MFENNNFEIDSQSTDSQLTFRKHVLKTFGTMALGLFITAASAVFFLRSGLAIRFYLSVPFSQFILLAAQIGVVFTFSARLFKASVGRARTMFFVYSVLTGVTFSMLGMVYTLTDISLAFTMAAVYFGSLVAIGYTTKMDLSRFAPILFTGLIILIVFNLGAYLFNVQGLEMIICSVGLLIFTGITAYDAQKMKRLYVQHEGDTDMLQRLSIYSALELYLDFINIFLYILRLLGSRD